jgi:quercetin dioxygenase-like cupin family protein
MTVTEQPPSTQPTRAVVRHTEQTPSRWFLNGLMTTLVDTDETAGAYCMMEHVVTAASNPPLHVHMVEDEAFYVLEGELELVVGGKSQIARAGTYALAPRGVEHYWRVLSDEARLLVITSGDAPEGGTHAFFEAVGTAAPARELPTPEAPDPAALAAEAEPRGIVLLGPPPA